MKRDIEVLKLSRDDYDQQEKVSSALRGTVQFLITLTTGLGSLSVAMWKPDMLVKGSRYDVLGFLVAAGLVWYFLLRVLWCVRGAMVAQRTAVPRSIEEYLDRAHAWIRDLCKSGAAMEDAVVRAESDMIGEMTAAYAASAKVNRSVNIDRQRFVAKGTTYIIVASLFLAVQALANSVYVCRETVNGREKAEQLQRPIKQRSPSATSTTH